MSSERVNVSAEKLFVGVEPCLILGHIHEVSQVADKDPLEDIGVQITGVVMVTLLHQDTILCHPLHHGHGQVVSQLQVSQVPVQLVHFYHGSYQSASGVGVSHT